MKKKSPIKENRLVPFSLVIYVMTILYFTGTGILFILPLLFPSKETWEIVSTILFHNLWPVLSGIFGIFLVIMKLFFPVSKIIFFGDFLPVLGLLFCSIFHLFGYIRISRSLDKKLKEKGSTILSGIQVPAGFVILGLGIIHLFLAPIPVL